MRSFVQVTPESIIYLKPLAPLVEGPLKLYVEDSAKIDRLSQDGIITALGDISGLNVGIIYQDFRVNGASVSKENAQRMMAFMGILEEMKLPLIFIMNSLGVRITQGRTIFNDAFSVIPTLFKLKTKVPVITAALGNTIGINAIYFAQGHYRLAVNTSALNLAGPEVHRRFFGDKNLSFNRFAPASHQMMTNTLVHETTDNVSGLMNRIKEIASLLSNSFEKRSIYPESYNQQLKNILDHISDEVIELFPRKGQDVKVFIGKIGLQKFGIFLNPPQRPNNLLTVSSIDKMTSAIELFETMKLPIISVLDCPGGDPRQGESDADAMIKMTNLVHLMIKYPFPKMGIISGRCFGGSGMFGFPKIFGGSAVLVVKGSQIGIMNESIIKEILANSPRLFKEWQLAHETEREDLQDMIDAGIVTRTIEQEEIRDEIKKFLLQYQLERIQDFSREISDTDKLIQLNA